MPWHSGSPLPWWRVFGTPRARCFCSTPEKGGCDQQNGENQEAEVEDCFRSFPEGEIEFISFCSWIIWRELRFWTKKNIQRVLREETNKLIWPSKVWVKGPNGLQAWITWAIGQIGQVGRGPLKWWVVSIAGIIKFWCTKEIPSGND